MTKETLAANGVHGDLFMPDALAAGRPAMLAFGGSEGGLSSAFLAAQGYSTLAQACLKEPGLPATLSRIPLGSGDPNPVDAPDAVIPVEQIKGRS
jgi:hypothetical protein